jgi:hypothetical protein
LWNFSGALPAAPAVPSMASTAATETSAPAIFGIDELADCVAPANDIVWTASFVVPRASPSVRVTL